DWPARPAGAAVPFPEVAVHARPAEAAAPRAPDCRAQRLVPRRVLCHAASKAWALDGVHWPQAAARSLPGVARSVRAAARSPPDEERRPPGVARFRVTPGAQALRIDAAED